MPRLTADRLYPSYLVLDDAQFDEVTQEDQSCTALVWTWRAILGLRAKLVVQFAVLS